MVAVGGFLDIEAEDIVFALDELTYEIGDSSTPTTDEQMEGLSEWDD